MQIRSTRILIAGRLAAALCIVSLSIAARADAQPASLTMDRAAPGYERRDGVVPFRYGPKDGKLFLEIPVTGLDLLYMVSLSSGATSPLERGPDGERPAQLVRFERRGSRVLLVAPETRYRASGSDSSALLRVAADVFPAPVLWSFPVVAEEGTRLLVDATDFVMRDAFGTGVSMRDVPETGFHFDVARSFIVGERSNAFPRNTEIETAITFTAEHPSGRWSSRASPDPRTLMVRQRHSFIALPDSGYRMRRADSRLGLGTFNIQDLSGSYTNDYTRRFTSRFRLEKRDPAAALSEPVQPIIVYLEEGIPAEYRDAVRDGTMYWNRVFEAAGFRNALRVTDLPAGADPLDIRYPMVVLWSQGADRKTSYASDVFDPRTGEIIKAIIHLDGYRSIEDYNRYAALAPSLAASQPDARSYVMTRRRWLVAHEMGHAIAELLHNGRTPTQVGFRLPVARPTIDGRLTLDVNAADATDPLPYDEMLIKYAYSELQPSVEQSALDSIVTEGLRRELWFSPDDLRANPRSLTRMGGSDAVSEFARERAVRRIMLDHFDAGALQPGEPMSLLHDRLIPAYFEHRLAIVAVAKAIGGADYLPAARGDGVTPIRLVSPEYQRQALTALLEALAPRELEIPERIASLIPPRSYGLSPSVFEDEPALIPFLSGEPGSYVYLTGEAGVIRIFASANGIFDPLAWARSLADIITAEILDPQRAIRITALHARDPRNPSLDEVIAQAISATWHVAAPANATLATLQRVAQWSVLQKTMALAGNVKAPPEVRAAALGALRALLVRIEGLRALDATARGHLALASREIRAIVGEK